MLGCSKSSRQCNLTYLLAYLLTHLLTYLQGCCGAPAADVAVSGLWCRGVGAPRNGCAAENCTIDEATLHVVTGPWPEAAQAIVDAAGATTAPAR